jgi:hypothetical protein
MSYQKKVVYAFNNFYLNFLTDMKKYNDEFRKIVRKNFKVFDKSSVEHFTKINESIVLNKDDITKVELLPELSVDTILEKVEENEQNMINSYFYIFRIMVSIYPEENDENTLEKVLDIIKTIQNNDEVEEKLKEVLDDDLAQLLRSLKDVLTVPQDTSSSSDTSNPFSMLENSKIGSLAKEISDEINLGDLNLSNPAELLDMKNLTSSNNVLGNIISKVSDKIQNKISAGEISQSDLVNEALSFVGMMNNGSGSSGGANNPFGDIGSLLNNPMLAELIGGLKKDGNTRVQVDTNKVKNMETRERLRRKLDKKKQAQAKTQSPAQENPEPSNEA